MNLRWKIAQKAELNWWHWYLKDKDTDGYLQWKRRYWEKLLAELDIQLPATANVLDAGCGPAGLFMVLDHQKVVALDPLLDRYAAELAHFDPKAYPNVRFESCALEDFRTEQLFDVVFCLNAINHVADLEKALDSLIRVCCPGGQLFISIDAHNYPLLKKIFRLLPGDILHPHQHALEDYKSMLQQSGAVLDREVCYKSGFIFNYYILTAHKKQ